MFSQRAYILVATLLFQGCSHLPNSRPVPGLPPLASSGFSPALRAELKTYYDFARANPQQAEPTGRVGMLLHAWQQYDSAMAFYTRARALDPQQFQWAYYLAIAQANAGKSGEAVTTLRAALALNPQYLPARMKLAEVLMGSGEIRESRMIYEAVAKENPNFAPSWYWLGRAESAQGDAPGAMRQFQRACELAPSYGAAHYALALAYRKLGDAAQAREHMALYQRNQLVEPSSHDTLLETVNALNNTALTHLKKGASLGADGQIPEAVAEHLRALEMDPKLAQAHANLISLYGKLHQPQDAEKHYRAAIALEPNLAESYYDFGVLQFEQKDYRQAADAFLKTIEIDPHNPEAHNNLAVLLELQGRFDEATRHFRAALEDKPNYRLAHFHLGRLLLARGNRQEAIRQFQQTLSPEDESTPGFMYALAAAYARVGNRQEAIRYGHDAERRAASLGQTQLQATIARDLSKLEAGRP